MNPFNWIVSYIHRAHHRQKIRGKSRDPSDMYSIDKERYPVQREALMVHFLNDFFWKSFFYLKTNKVKGDYLEFGSGSHVRSFRLAYKYQQLEYEYLRLFAFDSFQGLPEPVGIDNHPQWYKGALAVSLEQFHQIMKSVGASEDTYHVVPGFYKDTLDKFTPTTYGIERAAMVFVDCDLYASTMSVLNFVKDILVDGSILAFDDWFCFNGNPDKGEQKAFREFLESNTGLKVSQYLTFGWHGKSFIVHR